MQNKGIVFREVLFYDGFQDGWIDVFKFWGMMGSGWSSCYRRKQEEIVVGIYMCYDIGLDQKGRELFIWWNNLLILFGLDGECIYFFGKFSLENYL